MHAEIRLEVDETTDAVAVSVDAALGLKEANKSLLERAVTALIKVSRKLPPGTALQMLKSSTDVDMLQSLLVNGDALAQLIQPICDPLAAARLRGARQRQEILSSPDMLSAQQVAELLGISRQAVDLKRKNGQLLVLEGGGRGYKYPAWQFEEGQVITGLVDILRRLVDISPWLQYRFLTRPDSWLQDRTPIEALKAGELAAVQAAASRYAAGEQGGH